MRFLAIAPLLLWCGYAADLCPAAQDVKTGSDGAVQWRSYSAKAGQKRCVDNRVEAAGRVEWPAAGIEFALVDGPVEVAVCCFRHESAPPGKMRVGDREILVPTHREDARAAGKDDDADFPDLIEEDAHGRAISIRGTVGGLRVDVLLRCTASKFADQYAFQFAVIDRSADKVEIDWDHLTRLRAVGSPSVQPIAGGTAYVFLTAKRPREAGAVVELKTGGRVLGRFHFDGFTLAE
jgi:hypothetical protein